MGCRGIHFIDMICNIDTKTAAEKDICYMAGSEISNNGTFAVTDASGNPVDLTGVVLEMQVKYKPDDPLTRAIIVFKTSDSTITISGASNNLITLHGNYQVKTGLWYHDLYRFDNEEYIMAGRFNIVSNVTRN